jgi:hypothetical protein
MSAAAIAMMLAFDFMLLVLVKVFQRSALIPLRLRAAEVSDGDRVMHMKFIGPKQE